MTKRLENLDLFPLKSKVYNYSYEQYTFRWLVNGIGKSIVGDDDFYRKLVMKLNRTKLLHAHFGPTGYDVLKIKEKLGVPLITTFYGYDMSMLPRKTEWQEKYRELFEKGDLFLVEGTNMKWGLIGLGCPEEKIKIQHIAIDINQFQFRARVPKNNEKVILLFCGRFTEKKV